MGRLSGSGSSLSVLAAAVVCAAVACATVPRAPEEGGPSWVRVATPHFMLDTDLAPSDAAQVADQLETWRAAIAALLFVDGDRWNGPPLHTIALRSLNQAISTRGIEIDLPLVEPSLFVGEQSTDENRRVLRHEVTHALIHERAPGAPRWLNEGLAVYVETAKLDAAHRQVLWGIVDANEIQRRATYGLRVSFEDLLKPNWPKMAMGAYERNAGLLVHLLASKYPDGLRHYLAGQSWTECFPVDTDWDRALSDYAFSFRFATKTVAFSPPVAHLQSRPLPLADVHAAIALLDAQTMVDQPAFRIDRQAHFHDQVWHALALDPNQMLAGTLALSLDDMTAAARRELTGRLVLAHPDDCRVWAQRARTPGLSPAEAAQARTRVEALCPLARQAPEAAALVALRERRWSDAEEAATSAARAMPQSLTARAALFLALAHQDQCPRARVLVTGTVEWRRAFHAELARLERAFRLPDTSCSDIF